jgi:ketosteroid isomerase-like protein
MGENENRRTVERLQQALEQGNLQALVDASDELYSPDIVQEWPQSGERITGLDNVKAVNENYPAMTGTQPKPSFRKLSGSGDAWVLEGTIDYGNGIPVSWVSLVELRDGKIVKQTDYFADPFEAPAWRSRWVNIVQPVGR